AAALYGSRAANGVVLVTTKSGKNTEGLGISFNSSSTFDQVYMLPKYQNEYGGGFKQTFDLYQGEPFVNFSADESWGPRLDGRLVRQWNSFVPGENFGKLTPWVAHPDNVKDFYDIGKTFTNNIALTAGNDKANIRLSYTNLNQKGTMPNSKMDRNTFSMNVSGKLTDKLTASAKVNYVNTKVHGRPVTGDYVGNGPMSVVSSFNTWFQRQLDLEELKNYRNPDGTQRAWNLSGPEDLKPFYWDNPYFELYEAYSDDQRERVFGNISLSYAINPHLTITGFARSDFYDFRITDRAPSDHVNGSMFLKDIRHVKENNYEFLAQYNRDLGTDFSIAVNLGANARRESYAQNYGRTNGGLSVPNFYSLQASVDRPDIIDYTRKRSVNSIYGSATFGFKDIFYLDGSLRNDWSSTLPINNNSYLYPAASASLVFTELLPSRNFLSFGKIRAGWARVGNDTDPYRLGITYSPNNPFGTYQIYNVPDVRNNPVLKPERTASYEFGGDLRFLTGRVGIDATYYYKATTDQILDLPISGTTGYGFAIVNAGKITNKGVELVLTGTPVTSENGFNWDVTFNWAKNKSLVVALAEGQENYQLGITNTSDVTVNARVGQPYGTLVGTGFAVNEKGERLIDSKGFYIPEPGKVLGSTLPDYTGGLNNTFTYKNLSLSTLFDFRKGGKVYSITSETGTYAGLLEETTGLNDKGNPVRDAVADGGGIRLEGVTESGERNNIYINAASYWKDSNIDEMHIFDASFIKLREIRLGYTFPKKFFAKLPLQNLSFSLVGRNLAVLMRHTPHFDPETTLGSGNVQGIESAQLPSVRSFGFNLNASF
ncbi:MAG: SusC/RagA family TonB-linked outer membrane protein, partial [Bacteroidota bacterium]|nr:SusC/RagA family TonB-linked outer membrane protein [Bacteroidota bacterium]